MTTAFLFPGQGSQAVGMGRALADASPAARDIFGAVDEALGQHLFRLMRDGPEDELRRTANAQPAIMAFSMAVMATLEREGGVAIAPDRVVAVAGHSLGEWTALASAASLALDDCARLLRLRGEAMQAAVPEGEGAMAAILGLDLETVEALAGEAAAGEVLAAANDNAPGQVVVSGHAAAVERAVALAKARGARHVARLAVSAPFHCALMAPAAARLAQALEGVAIAAPDVPLWANVTAAPERDPARIRALLVEQVTGRVRWRETVLGLAAAGVTRAVEPGGKVLGPMLKRTAPDIACHSVQTPEDVDALLKAW